MDIDFQSFIRNKYSILFILIFSCVFTMLVYLSSYTWKLIVEFVNVGKVSYVNTMNVYIKSNIGKYLPGNIMQYAGRNVIGSQLGWPHSKIAFSSFLEVFLLIITSTVLSFIFAFKNTIDYLNNVLNNILNKPYYLIIAVICIILVIIALKVFLFKSKSLLEIFKRYFKKELLFLLLKVFIMQSIAFIIMGLMLVILLFYISNINIQAKDIYVIISIFIVAWLVGFIMPGVPGGLGVRESILLFSLSPMVGEERILLAILFHRLISILGDVIAFATCILFYNKKGSA